MRSEAPAGARPGPCPEHGHKCPDDPRHTPMGKLLRKLSLDEIPQLVNVLRGRGVVGTFVPRHIPRIARETPARIGASVRGPTMARWYVFDYGGVLACPQSESDVRALAELAGLSEDIFVERYWRDRDAFDLGRLSGPRYWSAVIGRSVAAEEVDELNRLDIAGWSHPDDGALRVVERLAAQGAGLALLSNAPEHLADAIDGFPWLASFDGRFYSCRIGSAKPATAAYRWVLDRLGTTADQAVFIDDREENVRGADALGMTGVRYTNAGQLASALELEP